ncbi:MAG: carboxyl-terminal protease [Gemmatimonadetes bacterium]|nr:carboxyl-terminal protease [Gemmatimonadota bacterium]
MKSRTITAGALFTACVMAGGLFLQKPARAAGEQSVAGAKLYEQVTQLVRERYVDTVSDSALYRKTVDGMLSELHDPYSVYLTGDRLRRLDETTSGHYAGVGIQIDIRDGWITIVQVLPGGAARDAGIQLGDRVTKIDGKPTHGMTSDEALHVMRGSAGSSVTLDVERPGVEKPIPFTLARREIHFGGVQHAMLVGNGVGYVDLTVFSENSGDELAKAVDSLSRAGMRSLVLDLRGDPGGLLDQGVKVADLFLNAGDRIVSMRGRDAASGVSYSDKAPQQWATMPLVVLVDSGSASASEIVAGALQDHDRALLVGGTTYGKGSAQNVFNIAGGALKLTTARWYTPSGRSIDRKHASSDDAGDSVATGAATDSARPKFKTSGGRTVLGGGGIVPDVVVKDSAYSQAQLDLVHALGTRVGVFRDVLTSYALALKARGGAPVPMRDSVLVRLKARGIVLDAGALGKGGVALDQLIGDVVARYVSGPEEELRRRLSRDPVMQRAVLLGGSAKTAAELVRAP